VYGLKLILGGHVQRPERQGSKREISGTEHSLSILMDGYGRKTIRFGRLKMVSQGFCRLVQVSVCLVQKS
jgi:hypothetical protein